MQSVALYLVTVMIVGVLALGTALIFLEALTSLPFVHSTHFENPRDTVMVGPSEVRVHPWSHINYSRLRLNRPEMDLLVSYLRPEHVVLEYGDGEVAQAIQDFVQEAYVISLDPSSCTRTASGISEIRCVPVAYEANHASYAQAKNYVDSVDSLGVEKFDVVFIDGRARAACALRILGYLRPSSLVFIHDFFGRIDLYRGVLQYYDEVARIIAYEHRAGPEKPKGIVALKRKDIVTDDLVPLSEDEIHSVYADQNFSDERYATRTGAFHVLGSTTENGFHLKVWKDEKKLTISLLRILCDSIAVSAFVIWLKALQHMYWTVLEPTLRR